MKNLPNLYKSIVNKLKEGLKNLFTPEEIEVHIIRKDGKTYRYYRKITRKQ